MDINDLRVLYTVLMFAVFIGVVWWAYGSKRKGRFKEAAQLPFNEPDYPPSQKMNNHQESTHE